MSEKDDALCNKRTRRNDRWYWCTRMKYHDGKHRYVPTRGPIMEWTGEECYPKSYNERPEETPAMRFPHHE